MIVKDYRTPFGREEVQPSTFSVLSLKSPTGFMRDGDTWVTLNERAPRYQRPPKVEAAKPCPVYILTACRCGQIFESLNGRRLYCGRVCRDAAHRSRRPFVSRAKPRVKPVATCGHDTRPVIAHGQCRPCYAVAWRLKKRSTAA